MAEFYKQERERQRRLSIAAGTTLAVLLHAALAVFGVFSGLKYIYPPPEERSILIDFADTEPEKPVEIRTGTRPRAADADPSQEINLVQKAEGQLEGNTLNEAAEATVGTDGDVEVPEPPRKKEINRRALFHAADNAAKKDTLAPQVAEKVGESLKAGHAVGNTVTGKKDGKPNADVKGRNVVGTLPQPAYTVQASGIVVVEIWVDRYGRVTNAVAGAEGTTVNDKTLWNEARKAAMDTQFNLSADAPEKQRGTITYVFRITQ